MIMSKFLLLLLAAPLGLACQEMNTPLYFNGPVLEAQGGEELPVENGFTLRFRNPTQRERDELQKQRDKLGYDQDIPWVARDKVHIQLSYKVTNLSDEEGTFTVMVDGANEYTKYDSKAVSMALGEGDELGALLPLMTSRPHVLPPGGSYSGLLREDDFAEGELDLDALGRWDDGQTFAAVLLNRSDVSPLGMTAVPSNLVVPAFVEINVNLQTNVHMQCEYVARVRDDDDRLLHESGDTLYETNPTMFAPAAM
jgi:hypothetical protein